VKGGRWTHRKIQGDLQLQSSSAMRSRPSRKRAGMPLKVAGKRIRKKRIINFGGDLPPIGSFFITNLGRLSLSMNSGGGRGKKGTSRAQSNIGSSLESREREREPRRGRNKQKRTTSQSRPPRREHQSSGPERERKRSREKEKKEEAKGCIGPGGTFRISRRAECAGKGVGQELQKKGRPGSRRQLREASQRAEHKEKESEEEGEKEEITKGRGGSRRRGWARSGGLKYRGGGGSKRTGKILPCSTSGRG